MNDRIKTIADAATNLFLQQGYSKTQISHIAKAAGISVGTIYLDFAGKKEIMHYILKCTIDPDFANIEQKRPVTDEQFAGIENEILGMFQKINTDFDKHLKDGAAGYTFEELISDAFDLLSKYAVGCLFIERNALDFPNLTQHYKECRRKFLGTMEQYLKSFIEKGMVRPIEQLDLSVTLIIEILSWWAMDRKYTSFELCNVSDELAKQVCMDNIITAYKQE